LQKAVGQRIGGQIPQNARFLNTVIGKMSRVVTDQAEIAELGLETIAPGLERAFLVEQFNRILVSRAQIPDFRPGIEVFIEKDDLLPFEEAKLYGHNAIHSLLGFIGAVKGYTSMTELKDDEAVMRIGRAAFLQESGAALITKYAHLDDELFTETGFAVYAEDLLERMTNPYLGDTVARVVRDAVRKLRIDGRVFGTMRLVLEHGIGPNNMALGAMAGIAVLLNNAEENGLPDDMRFADWRELSKTEIKRITNWLWTDQEIGYAGQMIRCIRKAGSELASLTGE
jgi:mannitol-1-phosphate 5-dehydrogenase